jgi:hypothetical protein
VFYVVRIVVDRVRFRVRVRVRVRVIQNKKKYESSRPRTNDQEKL